MRDIYQHLVELQNQNKAFALCMVTDAEGSTPRKAGAKMLVFPDASSIGTIGGGAIELNVIHDAVEALKTGKPLAKLYGLECDLSMQCGGNMSIYIEPFMKIPELYIFGAGHIGRELGPLASKLGFRFTYIDQREHIFESFNTSEVTCINGSVVAFAEKLDNNPNAFIVIATHEHALDEALASVLVQKEFAYIGMIGSKRKVAAVRKKLINDTGLSEELVNKINMPIGIPIKVETPFEIALSIAAKLADVKNTVTT
jgi:xanthine dehydrogenase accessory factor